MTNQLANQLNETINEALKAFENISIQDWNDKPLPEKWSRKEVLGHLIDSALNNIHRFIRVKEGDQTNIFYSQDFWVEASDYQNQNFDEISSLWRMINFQIERVWRNMPDSKLEKTIPVKDENPTLKFLMEDYIDHMKHHLKQIY